VVLFYSSQISHMRKFIEQEAREKAEEISIKVSLLAVLDEPNLVALVITMACELLHAM